MRKFLHGPPTHPSTYAHPMHPDDQAARDRMRAYVEQQFTEAARAADDVPRGDDAPAVVQWVDLEPDDYREAFVWDDGWHEGYVRAWRRRGDSWEAFCSWAVDGSNRVDWVAEVRVKPVDGFGGGEGLH